MITPISVMFIIIQRTYIFSFILACNKINMPVFPANTPQTGIFYSQVSRVSSLGSKCIIRKFLSILCQYCIYMLRYSHRRHISIQLFIIFKSNPVAIWIVDIFQIPSRHMIICRITGIYITLFKITFNT